MDKEVVQLLKDIKKLIILDLIERGVQANTIADVLDVDKSAISRMVAARRVKHRKDE